MLSELEILYEIGKRSPRYKRWVCRWSTTNRGLRLHQVSSEAWGESFETPLEALQDFIERQPKTDA